MLIAFCTRINHGPLSTSLLGNEKEPNVFNSVLDKNRRNQPSPDRERNPQSVAGCAGEMDPRNGRPVPAGLTIPATSETRYPGKNELSCSATTHGWELSRHLVVDQFAVTGARLAILEQGHQKTTYNLRCHDSRAVRRAASPDSATLGGVKSEITEWGR